MPFEIPVQATAFGAPFQPPPAGQLNPRFRNCDLIRAAVMAGHPKGGHRIDPLIRNWRISTIRLAVQQSTDSLPRLRHPAAWNRLDPTEKGQIRNLLGNTITKLLCERLLCAPLMVFIDVYGEQFGFKYSRHAKRPDFVAQTRGGAWFTVEAKGRNQKPNQQRLVAAKSQAQANPVAQPGQIQAHVVSWIGQRRGNVEAWLYDPEPHEERLPPIELGPFIKCYYAPVVEILAAAGKKGAITDQHLVNVEQADFQIGLHPRVASLLEKNQPAELMKFLGERFSVRNNPSDATVDGYGPDGVVIVPGRSWPDEVKK